MRFFLSTLSLLFTIVSYGQQWPQHVLNSHVCQPGLFEVFDVDNDGDLDIAALGYNEQNITWFPNLGNGVFDEQQIVANTGKHLNTIHACDINNDGKKDIVSASGLNNRVELFLNLGNGIFGSSQLISDQFQDPRSVVSADINNDGWVDLFLASSDDNTLSYFLNTGNDQFQPAAIISSSYIQPQHIRLVDLTNDGEKDLIVSTHGDHSVLWFKNNGNGVFDSGHVVDSTTFAPGYVNGADWDNDGYNDIIFTGQNNTVAWLKNLGGGNFSSTLVLTNSINDPYSVEVGDYDTDGDIDIVTGAIQAPYSVDVLKNSGNGTFQLLQFGSEYSACSFACFADIDNSPGIDVVANGANLDRISVFQNVGNNFSNASSKTISSISSKVNSIFADDLDNDGDADIVSGSMGDGKVAWYENLGNNNFSTQRTLISTEMFTNEIVVRTGDLNGDGYSEIIAAMGNTLLYFRNLSNGTFDSANPITVSNSFSQTTDLILTDTDSDGDLDIFIASSNAYSLFLNNGNGTFLSPIILGSGGSAVISWGDIDMDGLSDLFTGNYASNGQLKWHKNLGNNVFSNAQFINNVNYLTDIKIADLDDDGANEVITCTASQYSVQIYRFQNNVGFTAPITVYSHPMGANSVAIYDQDGDSDPDLVFSCDNHRIVLSKNNNHLDFGPTEVVALDNVLFPKEIQAYDLDGNGYQELICASNGDSKACWFGNLQSSATASGKIYWDRNENGIFDGSDTPIPHYKVGNSTDDGFVFTDQSGNYQIQLFDLIGSVSIFPVMNNEWVVTSDSLQYHFAVNPIPTNYSNLDFGIIPLDYNRDYTTSITTLDYHCADTSKLLLHLTNNGTTRTPGYLALELDSNTIFQNAFYVPDSVVGQMIYWSFDTLEYYHSLDFEVTFTTNPSLQEGTLLTHVSRTFEQGILAETNRMSNVFNCSNNTLKKYVHPLGSGEPGYISSETQWMYYTIRFSDLLTDTSGFILIEDKLSPQLDLTTLEIIASSHDFLIQCENNRWLRAYLDNPQINAIENAFLSFRIQLNENLPVGTQINNKAWLSCSESSSESIDSLLLSNSTLNTIANCNFQATINPEIQDTVCLQSQPFELPESQPSNGFYTGPGIVGNVFTPASAEIGENQIYYSFDSLFCHVSDSMLILVEDCLGILEADENDIVIGPNPFVNEFTVHFQNLTKVPIDLILQDINGAMIIQQLKLAENDLTIVVPDLQAGVYILQIDFGTMIYRKRIIKQ